MSISFNTNIKALIFDFDGTLANSMSVHAIAWKKTMLEYNITMTDEILGKFVGATSDEIANACITHYQLQASTYDISQIKNKQYLTLLKEVQFIPKIYNILIESQEKYKIAIGTNEEDSVFTHIINYYRLSDISNAIVAWNRTLKPKPHPDVFLKCAELLSLKPSQCHVFEDSSHGIEAAKNAGMSYTHVNDIKE